MTVAEYPKHPDNGCQKAKEMGYSGPCLECPFDDCIEEIAIGRRMSKSRQRRNDIRQDRAAGKRVKQLSELYKISERSVQRILARGD